MKLKKLEICGFKSFPEPTELVFHDGITAIVGPNGCGKSNIIDALRWVMGETSAKGLRGGSMGDVIFAGSDGRKGLNFAEVVLTLTQVEGHLPEKFGNYHEISIARRLHVNGDSEYLINKVPCRLKDIMELFMDTGVGRRAYSVVEQGRIDSILSAKPTERRFLIEEAAGITKYRSRKDEALRKMQHTAQNLQRLGDVIGEVRREMNSLKRQASRAEAYKRLREEKRALERDVLVAAWLELGAENQAAEEERSRVEAELVAAHAVAGRLSAALEQGRLQVLDEERALEARQRSVYHLKDQITQRQGRCDFLAHDTQSLEERAAKAQREESLLGERRASLGAEIEALQAEAQGVAERIAARAGNAEALQATHQEAVEAQKQTQLRLDEQRRSLMALLSDLTRVNHALDHAVRQESDTLRRLEGMGRQESEVAAKIEELGGEVARREDELAAAEARRTAVTEDRTQLDESLERARGRRKEVAQQVEESRKTLHTEQSRLRGLEQIKDSLEGYGAGVQAILRDARQSGREGILGVVADTISAPREYESALEAALGERLQYVIVADAQCGHAAVEHLKEKRAGRSSFAPVDARRAAAAVFPASPAQGAHGPLLQLVEVAPEYQNLAESLLGDVFVVETLEHALSLWRQNGMCATLVTLEGETVSPEGVISGGANRKDAAGLLRKNREIRELKTAVAAHAAGLQAREAELAAIEEEFAQLEGRRDALREEIHRHELQVVHIARDLDQVRERRERLLERRDAMEFEKEDLLAARLQLQDEVQELEGQKCALVQTQEALEQRVEDLDCTAREQQLRAQEAQAELTRWQVDDAADRQQQHGLQERVRTLGESRDNVAQRGGDLRGEIEECRRLQDQRREEQATLKRELEVLLAELEREQAKLSEVAQQLDERRGTLSDEEQAAAQARRTADEAQRRLNEADLKLRDLGLRADNLRERFTERLSVDPDQEAGDGLPEAFDAAGVRAQIEELAEKLDRFGEINLLAIEEYRERKERYDFLEGQRADLEGSLASLKQAIARINRVSRERFADTFARVSETFQELYPKLFRGGEAKLILTDPENMLDTGIDIVARPPGKKPQHISLLSGGEKALTAVALIFSIFLVKPSPFCILDEVDAPLDEANIGRFSKMVQQMASASQFFIITHNKSTMEAADFLYGVTMGEPGVSKVVSVQLADQRRPAEAA